jgi:SAM-dependent methyltransferase
MQMLRSEKVRSIAVCPLCHGALEWRDDVRCAGCRTPFPVVDGMPRFTGPDHHPVHADEFQAALMSNASLTAQAFNLGRKVISSEYMPRDHVREFLRDVRPGETVVELGSGNRRLSADVINLDLFPFANVDLVAEAERTPIRSGSVDRVVLDTVLEHVPEPQKVVDEIFRILRPGGRVVCLAPFIFPYHAYPRHYFNMSRDGLEFLFRRFSHCTVETNMGPTTAIVNLVSEYAGIALSENNRLLYSIGKGITLLLLFVLKYVDALWVRAPRSRNIASVLCATAEK